VSCRALRGSVEISGEIAFEAPSDLASCASFGEALLHVGLGVGVVGGAFLGLWAEIHGAQAQTRDGQAGTAKMGELHVKSPTPPLGRGFLTGTVKPDSLGDKDFRVHNPRFTGSSQSTGVVPGW